MSEDNKDQKIICYDMYVDFENTEKFDEFLKTNSIIIRLMAKDNNAVFTMQLIDGAKGSAEEQHAAQEANERSN
jgi:hypothetical protein